MNPTELKKLNKPYRILKSSKEVKESTSTLINQIGKLDALRKSKTP